MFEQLLLKPDNHTQKCYSIQVFADHESSLQPIDVPREWIWNLPRKLVYFGTSVSAIFKGKK